ncbi:glycerophosphodiester phosphodiesterase family protein [Lachnospiraceae bacterium LCP25S3_G4]
MYLLYIFFCIIFGLTVLYFILICPNCSRRSQLSEWNHTCIAHRGCHSSQPAIPENSMPAFKGALKEHLAIELDVHLTKDKQVVVFHDDTLQRMCRVNKRIEHMTLEELGHLHLLHTDEKIPLFEDILSYIDGRVPLLIELKLPARDTALCYYVNKILQNYNGPYMIQSFNSLALCWFKKNAPAILRGQLSSNLTAKESTEPYLLRFAVKYLLFNIWVKPDFISYKLSDIHNLSVYLNQHFYKVPIAVWTIRNKESFDLAYNNYNMVIFEKFKK